MSGIYRTKDNDVLDPNIISEFWNITWDTINQFCPDIKEEILGLESQGKRF